MATAVAVGEITAVDRTAALNRRTRDFSAMYERNAYVVYNVALRVCCEQQLAIDASKAAFLSRVAANEPEETLTAAVVSQSLAFAGDATTPSGAADPQDARLLEATSKLAPPQRAALALSSLADAGVVELATLLGLSIEAASRLGERALAQLGALLGTDAAGAQQAYKGWLWAPPPDQLWAELYPLFFTTTERLLREEEGSADAVPTTVLPALQPERKRRRWLRRTREPFAARVRRGPFRRTRAVFAAVPRLVYMLVLLLLVAGGIAAAKTGQLDRLLGKHHRAATVGGTFGGTSATTPANGSGLTPTKLDQLRMQELRQSEAYAQQLARQHASPSQQQLAQQQQQAALAAAQQAQSQAQAQAQKQQQSATKNQHNTQLQQLIQQQRQQLLQAQQQLQQQQLQQQQQQAQQQQRQQQQAGANRPHRQQSSPPQQTTSSPPPSGSNGTSGGSGSGSGSGSSGSGNAQQNCMLDENTGQYVCPQGGGG